MGTGFRYQIMRNENLFGGCEMPRLRLREPMVEEIRKPPPNAVVVDRPVGEMLVALFRAWQFHACGTARGPAAHHRVRDFGVKLDREGRARAKRLDRKDVALGEKLGPARQRKALAVPLVHVVRPGADRAPGWRRTDRVIADLGLAFGMRRDTFAQIFRQHLCAEADAEEWLVLARRPAECERSGRLHQG